MSDYKFYQAPYLAFYSSKYYDSTFARKWYGYGLARLTLVLVVCWVVTAIDWQLSLDKFVRDNAPGLLKQVPALHIKDAKATFDAPLPLTIVEPKTRQPLVVLCDTVSDEMLQDTALKAIMTSDMMIYRKSASETRTYTYESWGTVDVTRTQLAQWTELFRKAAVPVAYPFLLLGSFFWRFGQGLFLGLIGLLIVHFTKSRLRFEHTFLAGLIVASMAALVSTLVDLTPLTIPFFSGLMFALEVFYLHRILRAYTAMQVAKDAPAHEAEAAELL